MTKNFSAPGLPPGPKPAPVVGWLGNALRFFKNPVSYMCDLRETYGEVARFATTTHPTLIVDAKRGPGSTVCAFGAACNEQILSQPDVFISQRTRGPDHEAFRRISDHLLFQNGDHHRDRRRLILPIFSRRQIQSYYGNVIDEIDRHLSQLQAGSTFDLLGSMHQLTSDISIRTFFGLEPSQDLSSLASKVVRMVNMLMSPAAMVPLNLPGTPYRKLIQLTADIADSLQAEIERKRSANERSNDFISMLLQHQEDIPDLTDDEVMSQAFLMFLVGHDTTACALTWIFFLLTQHPEVAQEVQEEIEEILGKEPPSFEKLNHLPVLERTIQEALRVLSPAVLFPKITATDTVLGPYEIPAKTEIFYSPFVTHHDPKVFPDPKRFDPHRWLEIKPAPYEYVPFGRGGRNCIGAAFAQMQLKLVVAMMLQRFRLAAIPGTRIDLKVVAVMAPKNGLPMNLHTADGRFDESPAPVTGYIREMVNLPV